MPEPVTAGAAAVAGVASLAFVPAVLTDNDAAVLLALIAAVSSFYAGQQARKGVREGRGRRVVVTRHEGGTNVSDEELDELAGDGDGE